MFPLLSYAVEKECPCYTKAFLLYWLQVLTQESLKVKLHYMFKEKDICQYRKAYMVSAFNVFKTTWSQDKPVNEIEFSATHVRIPPEIFMKRKKITTCMKMTQF